MTPAWPPGWARGLAQAETDEASLYLATEAASWPELADEDRRAFALLVLAALSARGDGSTRLALPPGRGETSSAVVGGESTGMDRQLARLGVTEVDRAAVRGLVSTLAVRPALAPFVGRPGDYRPFILDGDFLYFERDLRLEERLAAALAGRLQAADVTPGLSPELPVPPALARKAAAAGRADGPAWTASQQAAIATALRRPLTIVTGGPGTGKTALIRGLTRAFLARGLPAVAIAIAAPTGKAANRIAELLAENDPRPQTVHRLLGLGARRPSAQAGEFRHHENRPLPHAAVIVDEASMIGLALMDRLLRSLRPDARLILIGDADQLPAVEAGSVFRDLVQASGVAVRLAESHRMDPADPAGAAVLKAARAVAAGALGEEGTPPLRQAHALGWSGFACLEAHDAAGGRRLLSELLDHWYATWIDPKRQPALARATRPIRISGAMGSDDAVPPAERAELVALLDHHQRLRLLTVTRGGPAGADRINAELARRWSDATGGRGGPEPFTAGVPVMVTENDYDRGLWNGDQGVVIKVRSDAPADGPGGIAALPTPARAQPGPRTELAVAFPRAGRLALFPLAGLAARLELAFASTVHKAQGSELDHAALLLPERELPLLSRELVYTAVTRVRRSMTIVGSRALLEGAIARPLERSSGLADRLTRRPRE